jgi:hypothetical protein
MTTTDYILIGLVLMQAGRYGPDLWRAWRRRGRAPVPRYTALESAVDAMSQIADGVQEDVHSLRTELRAAVNLPPESRVPEMIRELRRNREVMIFAGTIHIVLLLVVAWLVWELHERGILAYLAGR